jgi:hypothetical protein
MAAQSRIRSAQRRAVSRVISSRSHACLDWPRILDRTRATPAASVAMTAVLPLLQTVDVRAMRTALPSAHSRRARHESTALLSPSFDGAERAHELRLELQIATRHANRERLPSRARPRWPIADHPGEIAPAPIKDHCYPPKHGRPGGQEQYESGGNKVSRDSTSHCFFPFRSCGPITTYRTIFSAAFVSPDLDYLGKCFNTREGYSVDCN